MAEPPRQDRRTKAKDGWGHPGTSYPDASLNFQTRTETRTQNGANALPVFGTPHPTISGIYLVAQNSSPGDSTDVNLVQTYETLPGVWKYTKELTDDGVVVSIARRKNLISNITPSEGIAGGIFTKVTQENADALIADEVSTTRVLPGPDRVGSHTTQWGPATTITTKVETSTNIAVNFPATESSSLVPGDGLEGQLDTSSYNDLPGPYLYSFPMDPETFIITRVKKRIVENGTQGGFTTPPTTVISQVSVANPTVITLSAAMDISDQEQVTLSGFVPPFDYLNAQWAATVIDSTHFSVPANVSGAAGANPGLARIAAVFVTEIQDYTDRQSIEITSQIDTSSLPGATKSWNGFIQYPWPEVLVGIALFNDAGTTSTTPGGTFTNPCNITWSYGSTFDGGVGIQTARYTGKTQANVQRIYSYGPPPLDNVLNISLRSGEIVIKGGSKDNHNAYVVGATGTIGTEASEGNSIHYKSVRIDNIQTNTFSSAVLAAGGILQASITLELIASSPATFTPSSTFIASSDPTPGRLGLYVRDITTVTVPSSWPL